MNRIRAATDSFELWLYDAVESGFARQVVEQLQAHRTAAEITVRINSPGGSVSDGIAIYNALRQHAARVVVEIDGLAASIASLIAMAGDRVRIAENGLVMLHDPWIAGAAGNAEELRRLADTLDKHRDAMVSGYARKSRQPREAIIRLLAAESWFSAEEAVAHGFADEIIEPTAMAASLDLSIFANPPTRCHMSDPTLNPTPAPADPKIADIEAAAEARALQRVADRNTQLEPLFARFPGHDGMAALHREILADAKITIEQARQKMLAKLAEGVEPLGGDPFGGRGGFPGNVQMGCDRLPEFHAAVRDSLLIRHGVPVKDAHPASRDMMHMDMADVCQAILSQEGRSVRGFSRAELIKAGISTSTLPALLENVAEKALMTGFRESEAATHRAWTREGSLPDFKEARRVALSEAPGLAEVKEYGEYTYGQLSDAKETIQLATYGKIARISRQALINDDLGELTRLPLAMGQAAARKEADLVYTLLTSNPTMRDSVALFHGDHANLGSAAVPGVGSLGEGRKLMRLQKGLAGEASLNIAPAFIIVPAALETAVEQLLASITPATTGNVVPDWVRRLTLIVDSRLDDDSETAWYLAANPAMVDTVEVARLDGNGAEVIQDPEFDVDALRFKVRIDTGAAVLDWRGLVKNAGASE
jgi:ATP-dependent Clp endopeptidase proteolytic subunit ClpP